MSWKPATDAQRIEYLERQVADLQRAIEALQARAPASQWVTMSSQATSPWKRDAAPTSLPIPAPIFRPPVPAPRWDTATVANASLTTGAMLAMFSEGIVVICLGFKVNMEWFVPLVVPAVTLLFTAPITWCLLTFTPWTILSIIEKKTGLDLDGNGQIGDPPQPPAPERLEIEVTQKNEKGAVTGIKLLDMLNIPAALLREFATAAIAGDSLAVARWTGASGKFSQPQYQAMMAELERAGLVNPGHGNVGRSLSLAGRAVLRRIAG